MSSDNVELIRKAYEAYARGDLATMLGLVDPDLEWTYLDPSLQDPEPQVCHGRHELEEALERRAERGLTSQLEEVVGNGERVMVMARTPGVDAYRVRRMDDRNFTVLTVRDGRIVAIRDCRDRVEALAMAGLQEETLGFDLHRGGGPVLPLHDSAGRWSRTRSVNPGRSRLS